MISTALLLSIICVLVCVEAVQRPNIIFILTDDQDTRLGQHGYSSLGSMESMNTLQKNIIQRGTTFTEAFVNTPICCPSRTEFFTGRYYHNIGCNASSCKGTCMHIFAEKNVFDPEVSMFSLLQKAGYVTGVFGKVTNDQGSYWARPDGPTTGMDYISSPINYNDFDGLTYFVKSPGQAATVERLNPSAPRYGTTYQTTQIGNRTLIFLDDMLKGGNRRPFFAYVGPHAPHYPAEPAPWYRHQYDHLGCPSTPNYNITGDGKPLHIAQNPPFTSTVKCWEDQHFRDRWASLSSVDDLIEAFDTKLEEYGATDNTLLVYSSDHGYKLGQWRVGTSKQHPYETDIRVPLLFRGKQVAAGATSSLLVGNVDLLPTLLDIAGAPPSPHADGKSFAAELLDGRLSNRSPAPGHTSSAGSINNSTWRKSFLITYKSTGTLYNSHSSIWHDDHSGPTGRWGCGSGQAGPRSPPGDGSACVEGRGNCWYIDSSHSNSWRGIRMTSDEGISGVASNGVYVEYDPTFTFSSSPLQHYEYYNLDTDPYQLQNVYHSLPEEAKQRLHRLLSLYWTCGGSTCP